MSELKIAEFRERAEHGVVLPELAALEQQGHALRRRRAVTAAGALALVLVAGGGIARIATDGTDAAPLPATPPSPSATTPPPPASSTPWDLGVRTTVDLGEDVLLPGPSVVVYDGATVRFDAPGKAWEWWGAGMGLRQVADDPADYAGAVFFFLPDASARLEPCSDRRVQALGTLPGQLHGVVAGSGADPGWGGPHLLDLWHVVVPGPEPTSILVAGWDLDGTSRQHAEQQALLDSVRIGVS